MAEGWAAVTADEPFAEVMTSLDCPLLFAMHEGYQSTDEGFDEAIARIPQAETVVVTEAPPTSERSPKRCVRSACVAMPRRKPDPSPVKVARPSSAAETAPQRQ
jgi:hypothetical protein